MNLFDYIFDNSDIFLIALLPIVFCCIFELNKLKLNSTAKNSLLILIILFVPNILYILSKIIYVFEDDILGYFNFNILLSPDISEYKNLPVFADGFARIPLTLDFLEILSHFRPGFVKNAFGMTNLDYLAIILLTFFAFGWATRVVLHNLDLNKILKNLIYFLSVGVAMYLGDLARLNSWDIISQPILFFNCLKFVFYPYILTYILFWCGFSFILYLVYKLYLHIVSFLYSKPKSKNQSIL